MRFWPAISIIVIGAAVIATDLSVEVIDSRMSSTEYVSTLVTGAVVCVIGGAFEMNRARQLKSVAETGLVAAGRVPEPVLEEMMSRGGRAIGYAGIKTVQGGGSEGSIWPIEPYSPGEVGADLRAMLQHIGKMGGVDFAL